jgi:hypothetical protein
MRPLFSFRWRSSGSTMGRHEVARRRHARLAPVREEEEDRLGREGGLGRPRGRGPVGKGENGRLKRKENGPRLGRKAGWAESDGEIFSE